jgi:hypothetical protein
VAYDESIPIEILSISFDGLHVLEGDLENAMVIEECECLLSILTFSAEYHIDELSDSTNETTGQPSTFMAEL